MNLKTLFTALILICATLTLFPQTNLSDTTEAQGTYWVDLSVWPYGPSGDLTNAIWMMGGTPNGAMVDFRIGYDDAASLYLGKTWSTKDGSLSTTPMLGGVYGESAGFGLINHTTWKPWRLKMYNLNQFMTGTKV